MTEDQKPALITIGELLHEAYQIIGDYRLRGKDEMIDERLDDVALNWMDKYGNTAGTVGNSVSQLLDSVIDGEEAA